MSLNDFNGCALAPAMTVGKRVRQADANQSLRSVLRSMAGWILFWAIATTGCNITDDPKETGTDTGTESACLWDSDNAGASATGLDLDTENKGYVCPRADEDWYSFSVPKGHSLVTVTMQLDAPASPLDLTYSIWDSALDKPVATLASTDTIIAGDTVTTTFYLPSGAYFLQIRDMGNDAQDVYHPYFVTLQTSADADTLEPNNDASSATVVTASQLTGYISFDGDEDWYRLDGNARGILRLNLTMPVSSVAPAYRVVNASGDTLASGGNASGTVSATDISYDLSIDSADAWYVVVYGLNADQRDSAVAYTLQVEVLDDPDGNEVNDHPKTATELSAMSCGNEWGEWQEVSGYIATAGDVDWYHMGSSDCANGLIEVDVAFGSASSLPASFVSAVSLLREVENSSCSIDQDCQMLPQLCDNDQECTWLGNSCLSAGVCAGAGICLPSGKCGANWAVFQSDEKVRTRVNFTAPLRQWTQSGDFYISVSDVKGASYAASSRYTLRTRVMTEVDSHELANDYSTHSPSDDDGEIYNHIANAVVVPVHDCELQTAPVPQDTDTAVDAADSASEDSEAGSDFDTVSQEQNTAPPPVPGCCEPKDWIEGYISYTLDEDWYAYAHPCPGEDCMVRVLYDVGAGPVDAYIRVFQGGSAWYDNLAGVTEKTTQVALSGEFGGIGSDDTCFYAYNGHSGDPFWYYLSIRDTVFVSEEKREDGTWDSSPGQPYRFCIEKVKAGCQSPCQYFEGEGCGSPQ
ncbi:MAG: hypothetical protein JXX14_23610 [Deltaproteobacteria bacterium]|nr:hypothetical protein [Deltaproteobacteria bacterium]